MPVIQILLAAAGAYFGLCTICNASRMPTNSPWTICLVVAATFGASVGVVVTALTGDMHKALFFSACAVVLLLCQLLWRIRRGIHSLDFILSMRGQDAKRSRLD